MGSFKQLKSSDVITVPVIANKTWNFNYCPLPYDDPYITVYNGTNYTNSFNPGNEPTTNTHYDRLTYRQINQLFYHQYSGSLNTASLASSIHYISASSQHPSASFFNFNNDPAFISYFPTGANETIRVIQISPKAYGNKVLPYSFQMSSSTYNFYDDGKGNIYDDLVNPSPTHAGNIFYSEGTVVITSQNYQNAFVLPAIAYDDTYNIVRNDYPNPLTFSFYPLVNDDLRGNILIDNSIQIFGGNANFFRTGSNNSVSLSFSGLGTGVYQTFYTFFTTGSYCAPLMSSTGSITVTVTDPECEFEIGIIIPPPFPPSLSVSPTPTRTVTPTPTRTVTPTVTPSKTVSNTPSVTPSKTPTVTVTPSPSTNYEFRAAVGCCFGGNQVIAVPSFWGEAYLVATNGQCYNVSTTVVSGPATLTWGGGTLYADCATCNAANICPSPSPSATPSATPSVTPSITPSKTPSTTPSITVSPSITPSSTPSVTPSITVSPSVTPSSTPSVTPSITVSPSVTPSLTVSPSITPSLTVSPSITPSITPSVTPSTTPYNNIYTYILACNSYYWPVTGITYFDSDEITETVGNVTNTLILTICSGTGTQDDTQTVSAVSPYIWSINGQSYTTSGIYSVSIGPCADGGAVCTYNLDLTIIAPSPTPTSTRTPTVTPSVTPSNSISSTPSVTPSNTPSITPSITVSPSITPSITVSPSITPSITPSPGGSKQFQNGDFIEFQDGDFYQFQFQ